MQKRKKSMFKDGYFSVFSEKESKSDFNAVKNIRKMSDLNFIVKLAFDEVSRRESDIRFAESMNRSLSIKVKTRLFMNVNKKHSIVIGSILYSIINIDYDRVNQEMFLYLEEVREIESA